MGRYTSLQGVAAAARFFTRKFGQEVSETTLHSVKKAYLQEVTRKRAIEDDETVDVLPHQKREDLFFSERVWMPRYRCT